MLKLGNIYCLATLSSPSFMHSSPVQTAGLYN